MIWMIIILDADGLRDYIIDHGGITSLNDSNQSPDEYIILNGKNIRDMDTKLQSQITQLHFAGNYDPAPIITSLDFSSHEFNQLQFIRIGRDALFYCHFIQFRGI